MPCKVTFFYHDNLGGFSESWIDNTAAPGNIGTLKLRNYLTTRMAISGAETFWDYVRVSDTVPANRRLVSVYRPTSPGLAGVPTSGTSGLGTGHDADEADFAGTRLMVRKTSSTLQYARTFFGGFPDKFSKIGGVYKPDAVFAAAFALWAATVKQNGWGWFSRTVPIALSPSRITAMAPQGDNTILISAADPIFGGFLGLDRIVARISGQIQPGNLNKSLTVTVVNANQVLTLKPIAILPFVAGAGRIGVKNSIFAAVDSLAIEYVTKRGPGRPFGLFRGRSKVKPLA